MIRLYRLRAAITVSLTVAGASAALLLPVADARAQTCDDAAELAVMPSPLAPWKGAPLRVIFAAEKPLQGEFSLIAPNGQVAVQSRERRGGPPYFWLAEVASPAAGKWQARLVRDNAPADCRTITREIDVAAAEPPRLRPVAGSVWPIRNSWNRTTENLYSAWIEKLFEAPLDASPSWPALHVVLRDPARNVLHNHLGLREDSINLYIRPDCADLPYFLRAYFAFKMGLPYGYAKCTRGGGGNPPRCPVWWNIEKEEPRPEAPEDIIAAAEGQAPGSPPRACPRRVRHLQAAAAARAEARRAESECEAGFQAGTALSAADRGSQHARFCRAARSCACSETKGAGAAAAADRARARLRPLHPVQRSRWRSFRRRPHPRRR